MPAENREDVVTSLEEWAARLLEPDIPMILDEAMRNKETKARFNQTII
jgi:hypothetical protein